MLALLRQQWTCGQTLELFSFVLRTPALLCQAGLLACRASQHSQSQLANSTLSNCKPKNSHA